jgi:hypothetical protein
MMITWSAFLLHIQENPDLFSAWKPAILIELLWRFFPQSFQGTVPSTSTFIINHNYCLSILPNLSFTVILQFGTYNQHSLDTLLSFGGADTFLCDADLGQVTLFQLQNCRPSQTKDWRWSTQMLDVNQKSFMWTYKNYQTHESLSVSVSWF